MTNEQFLSYLDVLHNQQAPGYAVYDWVLLSEDGWYILNQLPIHNSTGYATDAYLQ